MEAIRPHLGVCPQYNVLFDMWVLEGLGYSVEEWGLGAPGTLPATMATVFAMAAG